MYKGKIAMKKNAVLLLFVLLAVFACSTKLTTEGDSLAGIKALRGKNIGTTYTLTLSQINIEGDRDGQYIRCFSKQYETIFIYFNKAQRGQIANLERNKNYIYKFKISKNDEYSTLSGVLLQVATEDGKPVRTTPVDPAVTAKSIILDGADAKGKTCTLVLNFDTFTKYNERDALSMRAADAYGHQVYLYYTEAQKSQVEKLIAGKAYTVQIRVENVDYRVFGSLEMIR